MGYPPYPNSGRAKKYGVPGIMGYQDLWVKGTSTVLGARLRLGLRPPCAVLPSTLYVPLHRAGILGIGRYNFPQSPLIRPLTSRPFPMAFV